MIIMINQHLNLKERENIMSLSFQDHYELWLQENNADPKVWTYEKWINDHCFRDFKEVSL